MAEVAVSVLDTAASTGNEKISFAAPQQELDGKKKRLLEELESAFVVPAPIPKPPNCLGFGIEVIDETALLDSIPKKKQSRRKPSKKIHNKTVIAVTDPKTQGGVSQKNNNNKYSRDEMEVLRFVNVSKQRKFWKTIYAALQSAFADEYDTLVSTAPNYRQPLPFVSNNKPIFTGVGAANGRCRYMNVFVH